jgi:hypothetical protein
MTSAQVTFSVRSHRGLMPTEVAPTRSWTTMVRAATAGLLAALAVAFGISVDDLAPAHHKTSSTNTHSSKAG